MRVFAIAVLLALAASAHASFETEPREPTDASPIVLQVRDAWRDGCLPIQPRVTRTGQRIEVRWGLPDGGCPLAVREWNTDVGLGTLPAGEYELVLNVDDHDGIWPVATRKLVVRESLPRFRVEPDVVSSAVETEVRASVCFEGGPLAVTMNGVAVPARIEACRVVITLPPHAPGAVDLRIQHGPFNEEVVAAVRYMDPAVAPDSSLYERVLVPVLYEGSGAYGSQWVTEVEMINRSTVTAHFLPDVAKPLTTLAPGARVSLDGFGNRPSGLLLFVPRALDIRFGSMIRDLSRDATQFGTEIPVVRERDTRPLLTLASVPFDPRYRVQLRVYDVDGADAYLNVGAVHDGKTTWKSYTVLGPCGEWSSAPCNSNQPTYAAIDLAREFPSLMGKGRFDISVENSLSHASPRLWAFVTVTNNETQHVTVISPQ